MANEPIQGGPYPLQSTRADGPGAFKAVVDWAATKLNMTFPTLAELQAKVPTPHDGAEAYVGSGTTGAKYIFTNGIWQPQSLGRVIQEAGTVTVPVPAADTNAKAVVSLSAPFTDKPHISLTALTTGPESVSGIAIGTRSPTSFEVWVRRPGAWDLGVSWHAVQVVA